MAKREDEVQVAADETEHVVVEPAVEPEPEVVDEAPAPAAAAEAPLREPHPVTVLGTTIMVDPEIEDRRERIAAKEAELEQLRRDDRVRLVEADRALTIHGLDQREAELDAQLARVRGDKAHEE